MSLDDTAATVRRMLDQVAGEAFAGETRWSITDGKPRDWLKADRAQARIWVDQHDLTKAVIRRVPHVSEGSEIDALVVDVYMDTGPERRATIAGWLGPLAALLAQDRAIRAEGGDPAFPAPRHHQCHPFVHAAMAQWGISPEEVVRPLSIDLDAPETFPASNILREDQGILTRKVLRVIDGAPVSMSTVLHRRVVHVRATIEVGGTVIDLFEDRDGAHVRIEGAALPESTLAGAGGRTVGDYLSGAGLEPLKALRIVDAYNRPPNAFQRGSAILRLEQGRVPLA